MTAEARDDDFDSHLIALRRAGKSFASIAREMDLARPRDASDAFIVAVRRAAPAERVVLCDEEVARLRTLEEHVRAKQDLAPADRDRRLGAIARRRDRLVAP